MRRFGWRFWLVVSAVTVAVIVVGGLLVLWIPEGWQGYTFFVAAAITGVLTLWAYLRGIQESTSAAESLAPDQGVEAKEIRGRTTRFSPPISTPVSAGTAVSGAASTGRVQGRREFGTAERLGGGEPGGEADLSETIHRPPGRRREDVGSQETETLYWSGPLPSEKPVDEEAHRPLERKAGGLQVQARAPSQGKHSRETAVGTTPAKDVAAVDLAERNQTAAQRWLAVPGPQRKLAEAHHEQGVALLGAGACDEAIDAFSRALQLIPFYTEAWFDRGTAYAEKGDFDRAITDFDRAIELRPKDGDTHFNRGTAHLHKGNSEQALTDFDNAIGLKPDLAEAYFSRGVIRQRLGKNRRAIADFERFLRLSKDADWRQLAEEKLAELRKA